MIDLNSPIQILPGIGSKVLEKLRRLGIKKVSDILFHLPFRYEDFSNIKNIFDLNADEKATITARILNIGTKRTWKRKMTVTEALLEDKTAPIRAVWFNQPYLADTLKKGVWVNISGKVSLDNMGLYFSNPVFEILGSDEFKGLTFQEGQTLGKAGLHTGGLVAIYPETAGLTSRWLRLKIKALLDNLGTIPDFLPGLIAKNFDLADLNTALRQIHFPKNQNQIEAAQRSLAFRDIFLLQLHSYNEKQKIKTRAAAGIPTDVPLIKKFTEALPFQLTDSQRLAAWQILKDLEKSSPMNRLLVGDVGSGKTVVAAISALSAAHKKYQVVFMAPTEILALQHFKTITELLAGWPVKIALLTSAHAQLHNHERVSKSSLIKKISAADVHIAIGTHALIQKEVRFKNLALVVVDEQHRFGVEQRAALLKDPQHSTTPHLLTMTATPIPRTLALTLYGDLDLSLLKELPKGRKKIITKIVAPANREKAYDFIENEIKKGRQAFVICPRIDDAEKCGSNADQRGEFPRKSAYSQRQSTIWSEVKNATAEYKKLSQNIFPHLKIGLLHGRLKSQEKETVMKDFKNKKTDILVSTSVVEVGIDIPNASVMMIEGADRFGLSQLHQFRGRVGRAEHQSYCFLFTESSGKMALSRLKTLSESEDGFKLAEKDLQLRGPGQFFGTQQSGLPDLAMSSLKNPELIEEVQQAVKLFTEKDTLENHPELEKKFKEFKQNIHWE